MLLVCAATAFELAACPEWEGIETRRLITGVGGPATFHGMGVGCWVLGVGTTGVRDSASNVSGCFPPTPNTQHPTPNLILNIGIAGAYPETGLALGDIVLADGEIWADVGMELPQPPGFLPLSETDFGRDFYAAPFATVLLPGFPRHPPPDADFQVHVRRGATVNSCTGTRAVGERRARQTGASFETMEGAAVAQIGATFGIPVCEVRAISNIASDRDMRPENIRRALENLRRYLVTTTPLSVVSFDRESGVVSGE